MPDTEYRSTLTEQLRSLDLRCSSMFPIWMQHMRLVVEYRLLALLKPAWKSSCMSACPVCGWHREKLVLPLVWTHRVQTKWKPLPSKVQWNHLPIHKSLLELTRMKSCWWEIRFLTCHFFDSCSMNTLLEQTSRLRSNWAYVLCLWRRCSNVMPHKWFAPYDPRDAILSYKVP